MTKIDLEFLLFLFIWLVSTVPEYMTCSNLISHGYRIQMLTLTVCPRSIHLQRARKLPPHLQEVHYHFFLQLQLLLLPVQHKLLQYDLPGEAQH